MKKFKSNRELIDWIYTLHLQNTSGRESPDEMFELGIKATIEELTKLNMLSKKQRPKNTGVPRMRNPPPPPPTRKVTDHQINSDDYIARDEMYSDPMVRGEDSGVGLLITTFILLMVFLFITYFIFS